jgi:hypothetical protein
MRTGDTVVVGAAQDLDAQGLFGNSALDRNLLSPAIAMRTVGLLWRWLWGDFPARTYWIQADACHGAVSGIAVRVYPELELKASVALNWGATPKGERQVGHEGLLDQVSKREWGFSATGALSYKFDEHEHVASQDFLKDVSENVTRGLGGVRRLADAIRQQILSASKVEVTFPIHSLTISVSLKKEEERKGRNVNTVGEVALDGTLIGGSFEVDFLDVILAWAGMASLGVGKAVLEIALRIKRQLKENDIADIDIACITKRNKTRKTDIALSSPIKYRGNQCTRLRYKS